MTLSADSQAILLLCSHLGLALDPGLAPLTLREWNLLAKRIQDSELKRPGGLLVKSANELQNLFDLAESAAARLARLLGRTGSIKVELERLASLGIRAMTRADLDYPQRYRLRLKESAPVILSMLASRRCWDSLALPLSVHASLNRPVRKQPLSSEMPVGFLAWSCILEGRKGSIRSACMRRSKRAEP